MKKINGWSDQFGNFTQGGRPVDDVARFSAATLIMHDQEGHEPVFTQSEIEKLIMTLRMAFNVIDEMNAEKAVKKPVRP